MTLAQNSQHNDCLSQRQTKQRGKLEDEYNIYRTCANDGKGNDITTGKPLLTFDQWLAN